MKVRLENFGKVTDATVSLDGITVIAGPNKSGKSTIGRAFVTLGNVLRRMDETVRDRKLRQFMNRLGEYMGLSEFHISRLLRLMRLNFPGEDFLSQEFWRDDVNRGRLPVLVTKSIQLGRPVTFKDISSKQDLEKVIEILEGVLGQDDLEMAQDNIDSRFNDVFSGQINSLLRPDTEAVVSVFDDVGKELVAIVFRGNKFKESRGTLFSAFQKIIYLEPLHLLDVIPHGISYRRAEATDRYRAGDCSWNEILALAVDENARDDISLGEKKEIEAVVDEIATILGGAFGVKDGRLCFKESSFPDSSSLVELENLASGMKSMLVVLQALRKYLFRRGMLFVIDEPESNLHPEWQVKFAAVLVSLWKRLGVKLLITTHSPYFLKSIETCAANFGCLDSMVSYMMRNDETGFGMVAQDVTDKLNEVYKTFFDPLNNLVS